MRCLWQVEIDPYCCRVLARHWPDVPKYEDVRDVGAHNLEPVDLIAGGFPCQDISYAGKGAGLTGERSGLWFEFARIIRELGPRYVLVENVPALRSRGLGAVLGTLAACGYDAEWDCIPASALGAPHQRDRIWIIAYPDADQQGPQGRDGEVVSERLGERLVGPVGPPVAYAECDRVSHTGPATASGAAGGVQKEEQERERLRLDPRERSHCSGRNWLTEPDVGRVANGVPSRVDRLRGLGNAVVPPVAEWIGRRILAVEAPCQRSDWV